MFATSPLLPLLPNGCQFNLPFWPEPKLGRAILAANDSNKPAKSLAGLLSSDTPWEPSPTLPASALMTPTAGMRSPVLIGVPSPDDDWDHREVSGRVGEADLDRSL